MSRLFLVSLALSLTLLAAACGGGGGSGSASNADAAVVGGEHISRTTLDGRIAEVACSYKIQKKTFPKAGSQEYQALQQQLLQELVQGAELTQRAPSVDVSVTDKQVEAQMKLLKKQYFAGSEKRYLAELKRRCTTDGDVRERVRVSLISQAIFKKVTGDATVSPADVQAYYDGHREVYTTPQSRVVSHILVKDKALADKIYAQLKAGAGFAALAKKYSIDPSTKTQGGRLTINRGQTVPEFDRVAFALATGALSKPVHSQYGWHIIHADKPATPHKSTPFSQVKESIRQQLLQQKQNGAAQSWLAGLKKEFASKVSYGSGLAPPATTAATTTG